MMIKKKLNIIVKSLFLYLVFFTDVFANQDFNLWLKKFQTTAIESGISMKVVNEIMSNVRSGMSYSGASSLQELKENAVFRRQSNSSNVEGNAHIFNRNK